MLPNIVCQSQFPNAGGDEPPEDINKLKTKVRRLYDIANVLTTLNLISKVHIPPSRRPAFVWLGIQGIHLQQQPATQEQATTEPESLATATASHSEAASSTATGSSMQDHTHHRHLSSGTVTTSNLTQADSQSASSKGLKRGAVPLEPTSAQKCARTAQPKPSNILYGTVTSPQRPPPSAGFYDQQAQEDIDAKDHVKGGAEPGFSPAMGHRPGAAAQGKNRLRPTPVPITPEGGQPDGQPRHKVQPCLTQALAAELHVLYTMFSSHMLGALVACARQLSNADYTGLGVLIVGRAMHTIPCMSSYRGL